MKNYYCFFIALLITTTGAFANVPGGGTGTGPDVKVTDNGTTVVLNNGIVAATITKSSATVTSLTYNGANVLSGGNNGGQVYWSWNMPNYQNPSGCTYTLSANPALNNGDYAEITLHMTWNGTSSTAAMDVDVYYALPRGTQGLYAAAMLTHPAGYPANPGGEWRMACYPGSTFDWLSVDSLRNRKMASPADWNSGTQPDGAPPEVRLLHTGVYVNQYECKYDYSADFGDIDVWGWSSTAKNIGLWVTAPSKEYYNGGPMKRELTCHNGPTLLNMLNGEHYGMGNDLDMAAGETWQKMYGPFLLYCNSVPAGTANAWAALWTDAKAQTKAEQAAWPYTWFNNAGYVKENGRGTVTGKLMISDGATTVISPPGMWVGVAIPPLSTTGVTDFQLWAKNYQFWVKTDAGGNFTIPHVLPGTYNLYAFGPGAAGTMLKTAVVTVTAGNTTNTGNVSWTTDRTAPTVWEIGIPDRSAQEFRHGTDWWTSNTYPNMHWGKFMDYTTEFPNGVNYTIGQSNWNTDWNFVQPFDTSNGTQIISPEWKVKFNLTTAPTPGSTAAVYVAFAASYSSALYVKVNGTNITTPSTGIYPPNASDAMVRKGIHGAFGDYRVTFSSALLHAGANEISFTERKASGDIMYDYVRLEAQGTSVITALPVELLPLSVTARSNTALLLWATASEQNNNYFEVQRADGIHPFTAIGRVTAKGNSVTRVDYSFSDPAPLPGKNVYRIKQIDKDGRSSLSNVAEASFLTNTTALVVRVNPVHTLLEVAFAATTGSAATCVISDAKGTPVKSFAYHVQAGSNVLQADVSALAAGRYFVSLRFNNQILHADFMKL